MTNSLRYLKRVAKLLCNWRFYKSPDSAKPQDIPGSQDSDQPQFQQLKTADSVRLMLQTARISFTSQYEERIKDGDTFVCLVTSSGTLVSYGWRTQRSHMPVSELGLIFEPGSEDILFDFYTPLEHRRRGFYTTLLRELRSTGQSRPSWIYAHRKNIASWKAIERAGFVRQSLLRTVVCGLFLFDKS